MRPLHPAALALGACLALAGCTEGGSERPAADDSRAPTGPANPTSSGPQEPAPTAGPTTEAPNFTFAIDEAYRSDPSTPAWFVERLEGFVEGALAPLERLPGLMPRTVGITYGRCGEAGASHDGPGAAIRLCHELFEHTYEVFAENAQAAEGSLGDERETLQELTRRVLAATGFVLYHEIAHALDHQRELPIVGNRESAMDAIATVIAVETGQFFHALAGAVVFLSAPPALFAEHGGGVDRLGDINCWALGGDAFVDVTYTDETVRETFDYDAAGRDCIAEYAGLRDTVRGWLPGLARLGDAGTPLPGTLDGDGTGELELRFGSRWLEGTGADPGARARVGRLFEGLFAPLEYALSGLPAPLAVLYEDCGVATSAYDPGTATITLCEEIVESAYRDQVARIARTIGGDPSRADRAGALQNAHDMLGFVLYHEIGHVLDALGRLSGTGNLEKVADAIATVLLVESGRGFSAAFAAITIDGRAPAERDVHDAADDRGREILCLVLGGDAALRAQPEFAGPEVLEAFITGERDCIAEYAARRDEVARWLHGA